MTIEPLPIHYGQGDHAGICIIELDQPGKPVVVLELELIQRLEASLDALPKDARGLVLASASERSFVAGADLKSIMAMDDGQLHKYLEYGASVFGKISRLPYPTAAAINGAALGGGLELAMHCDGLIGAPSASGKPYPVGLPEAGLSICPGWGGTQLLPARIEPKAAIVMTAVGKPMKFDEASEAGLFDAVCEKAGNLRKVAASWVADRADAMNTGKKKLGRTRRASARLATVARSGCTTPFSNWPIAAGDFDTRAASSFLSSPRRFRTRARRLPSNDGPIFVISPGGKG